MDVVLSSQNLSKEYSGEVLFSPFSFQVAKRDRMAILGPNGSGKTTLLKILLGQEEMTSGKVILSNKVTVGYLSQDVIEDFNHTLREEMTSIFKPLIEEEKKINSLLERISENPNDRELLNSYATLSDDFERKDGYSYQYKIELMLNMFSFKKEDYDRKISSFSGGEKTSIAFCKLLLEKPDILILDEPTNHLDIISIEWLEEYLVQYQGAVLFVSHDVAFVKKIANKILDIDSKVFIQYNCDYDSFCRMKKERYENLLSQYKAQEKEREKLKAFITFYMPKPRFASRARDRVKKLERLNDKAIDNPANKKTNKLSMSFNGEIRDGKRLLEFNSVSVGYNEPLVEDISFTLFGRDRLAIMGANGIGKSTFAKVLTGEMAPLKGSIKRYFDMSVGVLKQDIRFYSSDETIFEHFRFSYPLMSNADIYANLGRFAFSYEESNEKRLSDLSGGELMRVEILQLSLQDYDLLLLDEPTNHLDMLSISELIDALSDYQGTLVIISHNRDFVDKTCDKLLYFYDKRGYYHEGSYEEFASEKLKLIINEKRVEIQSRNATISQKKIAEKKVVTSKTRLTKEAPEKILLKIDRLEKKKDELQLCFDKEEYYSNPEKLNQLSLEVSKIDAELEKLYALLEKSLK